MSITGDPFDGYDGTDESFERLQEEQERQEYQAALRSAITVNGYEFTGERLAQLLHLVYWKQASGTDLNTIGGCREAAEVTVRFLSHIGDDYHPGGEKK